ncbi:hypothetical protein D3C75_799740 [compost metagenome]
MGNNDHHAMYFVPDADRWTYRRDASGSGRTQKTNDYFGCSEICYCDRSYFCNSIVAGIFNPDC